MSLSFLSLLWKFLSGLFLWAQQSNVKTNSTASNIISHQALSKTQTIRLPKLDSLERQHALNTSQMGHLFSLFWNENSYFVLRVRHRIVSPWLRLPVKGRDASSVSGCKLPPGERLCRNSSLYTNLCRDWWPHMLGLAPQTYIWQAKRFLFTPSLSRKASLWFMLWKGYHRHLVSK